MAISKGTTPKIYTAATASPTNLVGHMNNFSMTMNGKSVDVTEFAASAPTYIARASGIKDLTATFSGFNDKADAGQAPIWANVVSDTDLYVKITFTATTPAIEFKAVVDSIDIKNSIDGYVEVTFNVSNASNTVTIT
jgi:cytochrome b involved in lipid metabolism